jgi:hypothetical protein
MLNRFTNEPQLEPLNSRNWKVVKGFTYYINDSLVGPRIDIPPGFITDFASTPKIIWPIIPPWGKYGNAAIVHDFLYQNKFIINYVLDDNHKYHDVKIFIEKNIADKIFLHAMEVLQVPWWKRRIMFLAVKYFGNKYWRK